MLLGVGKVEIQDFETAAVGFFITNPQVCCNLCHPHFYSLGEEVLKKNFRRLYFPLCSCSSYRDQKGIIYSTSHKECNATH